MPVVEKEITSPTSPIVLRPSSDDDVPAMLDIYRHHIAHGVGNLGAFEPTPFDADDLKARRKNMLKHRLPHLVAIDGAVAGYAYAVLFRKRPAYRSTVKHSIYVHPDRLHTGVGRAPGGTTTLSLLYITGQRPGVAAQAWKLSLDLLVNIRHGLPPLAAAGSSFADHVQ
jgi:hypothetical protein